MSLEKLSTLPKQKRPEAVTAAQPLPMASGRQTGCAKEMGGMGGEVTNPEQLFAAGYSACFSGR